jgi:hypothetical protein
VDQAEELFVATYPFYPTVLSVFERKWQSLPRFQRTRGILRLLALWVSRVYQQAFREGSREPLITLGSAPLADWDFRVAVLEQLGEERLETAVLSDIAGEEAHAVRLDAEAVESLRKARLHQKVAATVFFESSGGQLRNEATLPEIRLAVGEPGLDIGNIETALENLVHTCYYLRPRGTAYRISHRPKLNKILADRRATLSGPEAEEAIRERVHQVIRETFRPGPPLGRCYFPESPADIPDVPALTLVVMAPEHGWENSLRERTRRLIMDMIQNYRGRGRTYKSGLLFIVAEGSAPLFDEAKTLLALESLEDPAELERYKVEDRQIQELEEELKEKKHRTERNLKEGVWRAYRRVLLLGEENELREVDLGLLHPSAAESLVGLIISRLKQEGLLEETISPDFLVRHWPPALEEWSTKAVRDTFFASPEFPRLLNPDVLKETIAEGVQKGKFGYRGSQGMPIIIDESSFRAVNVEVSDQVVLLPRDKAVSLKGAPPKELEPSPEVAKERVVQRELSAPEAVPPVQRMLIKGRLSWEGELPPQKWTNFYMKVLTRFATDPSLRLMVRFEVTPETGVLQNQLEEIKMALQELELDSATLKAEDS